MKRPFVALLAAALLGGLPPSLHAATETATESDKAQSVVTQAMSAVERGALDEAVDALELLSDNGFIHRDASLARAYAYVERARSRAPHSGDLGRAVAALEEARLLGPPEASFTPTLEKLRSEIARRRTREARSELTQRPALGRAVTALLSENGWALLAALGSGLLTLGLALRSFVQRRGAEIAGSVGIVLGLVLGLVCGGLAAAARHYRISSRPGVVVVSEARLLDGEFRPLKVPAKQSNAVPEGSLVYVREERAGRYHVEWGALSGWVDGSALRLLATRPADP